MKLISNDEDAMDRAIARIAKAIKQECKQLKPLNFTYNTRICLRGMEPHSFVSVSELDSTLPAGLVGIIVTGMATRVSTLLQGGMGVTSSYSI